MNPSHKRDVVTVTPYRDGPYLIRGPFQMLDQEGNEIPVHRPTIALCRCGKSRMRPLCDGTHRTLGFRASSGPEAWPPADDCAPVETSATLRGSAPRGERPPSEEIARAAPSPRGEGAAAETLPQADPQQLVPVLTHVRQARAELERALMPPLAAGAYTRLALAEPLLQAADRLLESIIDGAVSPHAGDRATSNGHGPAWARSLDAYRTIVEAALQSVPSSPREDRRVGQLRSLLQHAAEVLA